MRRILMIGILAAALVTASTALAASDRTLTGAAMAFARAVGEYGSVIFIAGNLPYVSEIAPLLIIIRLEEFDYGGATAIGTIMLLASFAMLLVINLVQSWSRRRMAA